jgi:hypothetical protein
MAETREGNPIQEHAYTSVVNAHGGLMKLTMDLLAGQPIILRNEQTKTEEPCRVVRREELPDGALAVAFAFNRPAPDFWPVTFPPDDWRTSSS